MFTVYVLYSPIHTKIYIGFSSDIGKRLFAHNHPSNKGWTRSFQPWTLIYSEEYETKADATQREKQLKSSKGRSFIKDIITSQR